jgi:diguanylate cyclase (GGDEF)-like protein
LRGSEEAHVTLRSVAGNMADRLDYRMFERYREIRNIAILPPLQDTWTSDPDAVRTVLEQLQDTYPDYSWIGYARLDGTVIAATNGHLEGVSVAERPWFIDGSVGPIVKDVHEAKLLANILGPSPDNQPFRFVDVAVPVRDKSGTIIGVLGAHLSWAFSQATMRSLLANLPANKMIDVWVLNSAGEVITGPQNGSKPFDPRLLDQLVAGAAYVRPTDRLLVTAQATSGYLEYPGLGWTVVGVQPEAQATATSRELAARMLQFGLLIAIAGAFTAPLIASKLLSPLTKLADEVDRIGREDNAAISRVGGSRELVSLSTSLRSLVRRLGLAEEDVVAARRQASDATERMEEKTRRLGEDLSEMRRLADTDILTGLLSRRAFNVFADDAYQHHLRYKRGVALLMIDIDFFKRVNDTFGHAAGDEVIRAVGAQISNAIRTTDKAARFGGEEFVVMLKEIEPPAVFALAERIRHSIAEQPVDHRGSPIHITVSIGIAILSRTDRDIGDAIERADRALYRAKTSGRNRVAAEWDDRLSEAA